MSSDPKQRTALISGLRDLADFLDTNPDVPAPWGPISIHFYPLGTDEEIRAQVDHVARLLGSDADAHELTLDHYSTGITFGVAEYKAVGLLASSRTRWADRRSYEDSITLDTDPAPSTPALETPSRAQDVTVIRYRCATCGGTGVDSLSATCADCDGIGIDNHGA